jgi:heme-degrading monooxygenase HmoA
MILEAAVLHVPAGQEPAFEQAMAQAATVIAGSPGYLRHELQRCIETNGRYLLLVRWATLEAHTISFRQSPAFAEWRSIIGPFFASAPLVEHYETALTWPRE